MTPGPEPVLNPVSGSPELISEEAASGVRGCVSRKRRSLDSQRISAAGAESSSPFLLTLTAWNVYVEHSHPLDQIFR